MPKQKLDLLELATHAAPCPHVDALRRFRVMGNVEELARALDYSWEKKDRLPLPTLATVLEAPPPAAPLLAPTPPESFQPGSFGYRPKKSAHAAVRRVAEAIVEGKTYVVDLDLQAYFDTVRHHIVWRK